VTLEFSRQTLEKYSNIKFPEIRPVGAELFHGNGRTDRQTDGRMDRYDEVNIRFSQFFERA
jgi:hypothetical protein